MISERSYVQSNSMVSTGGGIGFSSRINDPAFARYIKNKNLYASIFSIILAVVAIVGFTIYGEKSDEINNPEAMYIGLIIGGMFLLILLYVIMSKKQSKTWNGTIIEKIIKKKRRKQIAGSSKNDNHWVDYIEYVVVIKEDTGKKHEIIVVNDDTLYVYYQIGNRVRHHGQLNSYEKYDKSKDSIVFCNACATLNEINDEYCHRCKCPLLK